MFFKIEGWNFQVQFEVEFRKTLQNFNSIRQLIYKYENNNCLNKLIELKFCEVSRNPISNWTWKFQRSILKNKKVLFLKKNFFGRTTKVDPRDGVRWLNFPEGFGQTMWSAAAKPSGKLRWLTPSFGCILAVRLKKYFF